MPSKEKGGTLKITIGLPKDIIIDTFIWSWNDDEGRLQTNKLNKLL